MFRNMTALLAILFMLTFAYPALARPPQPPYLPDPVPVSALFSEQCPFALYASYHTFDNPEGDPIDIEALMDMQYVPGVWMGYGSTTPFGVEFADNRSNVLWLITPCGKKYSRVKANTDGSWTIFVFRDTLETDINDQPCTYQPDQPNPNYCGLHHFQFGYISADEWRKTLSEAS